MRFEKISFATGDGVGPEITQVTLDILKAAEVPLQFNIIDMGLKVWAQGLTSGVTEASWQAIRDSGVLLKGPMITPQGSGMKSLNVTLRKSVGLFHEVFDEVAKEYPEVQADHMIADIAAEVAGSVRMAPSANIGESISIFEAIHGSAPEIYCTDHWRCRFKADADHVGELDNRQVLTLLNRLDLAGVDFVKTEHLYNSDGQPGYSMGQGQ